MAIVVTENLTKVYGEGETAVTALDHVSMAVKAGEFVAVMGPSGCGKSTLLHLVGGLDRPTAGRVVLDGNDLAALSDDRLTVLRRRQIGFIFQFFNLIPILTASENASLPLLLDGIKPGEARAHAQKWLERLGLGDRLGSRPDQLSGGQQQRVAIARALVNRPSILLADEPTGNLDSRTSVEILALFQELNREGVTVILITHEGDIAAFAGRTMVLRDGRITSDGRRAPLSASEALARLAPPPDDEEQP